MLVGYILRALFWRVVLAPYRLGMDDFLTLDFRITSLLDAMLAVGRAFPYWDKTKIEVGVRLEWTENGYLPAVAVEIKNKAGDAKDISAEKSRVASKAALLALAMENMGTMTLEGAKVELYPMPGVVDASLEVETASKRQSQAIKDILGQWVYSKTYPGVC